MFYNNIKTLVMVYVTHTRYKVELGNSVRYPGIHQEHARASPHVWKFETIIYNEISLVIQSSFL